VNRFSRALPIPHRGDNRGRPAHIFSGNADNGAIGLFFRGRQRLRNRLAANGGHALNIGHSRGLHIADFLPNLSDTQHLPFFLFQIGGENQGFDKFRSNIKGQKILDPFYLSAIFLSSQYQFVFR